MKHVLGTALTPLCVLLMAPVEAASQGRLVESDTALRGSAPSHAAMPVIRAIRIRAALSIDGRLNEAVWASAPPASGFRQLDPREGELESQPTEVRIVYDDDALYLGLMMYQSDPVSTRLGRRDGPQSDSDQIAVILDSYHDHLSGYRFRVNPSGIRRDEIIIAGRERPQGLPGGGDVTWDPVWEAATTVTDSGWIAEFRIPFSQLRFSGDSLQTWGIQLERRVNAIAERSLFAFTPRNQRGGPARYGHLEGLHGLKRSRGLELLPYGVGRGDYRPVPTNPSAGFPDPFRDGAVHAAHVGVDGKLRLSTNVTLDATVNPDFGQVEVDPAVINLTAFETRYQERRPFFVERSEIFEFGGGDGSDLLYSRRVGRASSGSVPAGVAYAEVADVATILGAAKLTGRTPGGWSVGLIDAVTAREVARYAANTGERGEAGVEPLTNYFVGRVSRAFRSGQSRAGGMVTAVNREFRDDALRDRMSSAAYAGGLDFLHEWAGRAWSATGSLSGSFLQGSAPAMANAQRSSARYLQRPDADHVSFDSSATDLTGYAARLEIGKRAGLVQGGVAVSGASPGYEINDFGFQSVVDRVNLNPDLRIEQNRPRGPFRLWSIDAGPEVVWNYGGDVLRRRLAVEADGTFQNLWTGSLNFSYDLGSYDDRLTRGGPSTQTPAAAALGFTLRSDAGRRNVMTVAADGRWDDAGGEQTSFRVNLTSRPASPLEIVVGAVLDRTTSAAQYVTSVSDALASTTYGRRYIFADLEQTTLSIDLRVNLTFTPALTLELYAQPLISATDYGSLKELRVPGAFTFNRYGQDAGTLARDSAGYFTVDPDGSGPAASFRLADGDFSFQSLRGNAVLRWEWRRGSTLYLVWQHNRAQTLSATTPGYTTDPRVGRFHAWRDAGELGRIRADNVFILKVSYWLNP